MNRFSEALVHSNKNEKSLMSTIISENLWENGISNTLTI